MKKKATAMVLATTVIFCAASQHVAASGINGRINISTRVQVDQVQAAINSVARLGSVKLKGSNLGSTLNVNNRVVIGGPTNLQRGAQVRMASLDLDNAHIGGSTDLQMNVNVHKGVYAGQDSDIGLGSVEIAADDNYNTSDMGSWATPGGDNIYLPQSIDPTISVNNPRFITMDAKPGDDRSGNHLTTFIDKAARKSIIKTGKYLAKESLKSYLNTEAGGWTWKGMAAWKTFQTMAYLPIITTTLEPAINAYRDTYQHPERDNVEAMARFSTDLTGSATAGIVGAGAGAVAGLACGPAAVVCSPIALVVVGSAASVAYSTVREDVQEFALHNSVTDWYGDKIYGAFHDTTIGGWCGL